MSNPNANVRHFMGGINAAAYWIGDHLLRGADIVNDSGVTGTTVKAALNTLSAASYTYTSVRTTDQVIAVNNTVVDSSMAVTVPAGTYFYNFMGLITHSTASGGSVVLRCSTDSTVTFTGRAEISFSTTISSVGDSVSVTAGNAGGMVVTNHSSSQQICQSSGMLTCAATTTFTVAVFSSANQNITVAKGTVLSVSKTN